MQDREHTLCASSRITAFPELTSARLKSLRTISNKEQAVPGLMKLSSGIGKSQCEAIESSTHGSVKSTILSPPATNFPAGCGTSSLLLSL